MAYFITTLHVAVEAESLEDARHTLALAETAIEDLGCLSETASLPSGLAKPIELPSFDPETGDLHRANALARGDAT